MGRFVLWMSIFCAGVILYVGAGFIAPIVSGLILAFGLRPFESKIFPERIQSQKLRVWLLLLSFMAVFTTLTTYVIIASAHGIAKNVHLQEIKKKQNKQVEQKIFKDELYEEGAGMHETNEDVPSVPRDPDSDELVFSQTVETSPGSGLVQKINNLLSKVPGINSQELTRIWGEALRKAQSVALIVLSKILTAGPAILVQWVIFLITFILFFLNYDSVLGFFHSFARKSPDVKYCVEFFQNASRATLMGTLVVGTAQATIIAIGTAIAGFESFVLLGLCAFFASFIPFVGTALVWVSTLLYSLFNGDTQAAIIVGASGAISSVADNLILPTFIGSQNKVHPLLLFIVVIGFIELIGIWGLFIGPVLAIFSTRVFELWFKQVNA